MLGKGGRVGPGRKKFALAPARPLDMPETVMRGSRWPLLPQVGTLAMSAGGQLRVTLQARRTSRMRFVPLLIVRHVFPHLGQPFLAGRSVGGSCRCVTECLGRPWANPYRNRSDFSQPGAIRISVVSATQSRRRA